MNIGLPRAFVTATLVPGTRTCLVWGQDGRVALWRLRQQEMRESSGGSLELDERSRNLAGRPNRGDVRPRLHHARVEFGNGRVRFGD